MRFILPALFMCVLPGAMADERPLSPESYYLETLRARELFDRKQYGEALPILEKLTKTYSQDGMAWLATAIAANDAGQEDRSIKAAQRAAELGVINERHLWFEIAKLQAKQGKVDDAIDSLERALEKRLTPRAFIRDEPAFRDFANNERFRRIAGLLPARPFSRVEGWRYDLAFVATEARRLHASFSREAFSAEFAAATQALNDRIPELADWQIRVRLQQLLALLRDGHTGIDIDYRTQRLPVRLYFFPDGVFIVDARETHKDLTGSRVLRIGSRSVEQLLADLPSYIPRDNVFGIQWRGPHTLVHMDFLQALGAAESPEKVTMTVQKAGLPERRIELQAVPSGDPEFGALHTSQVASAPPLYLQQPDHPYWTQRLAPETLYVKFSGVWQSKQQSIENFAMSLHRELNDGVTRNVIVDVRLNSGGDLNLYPPLLQALGAFRIGNDRHEIYCITSRNTFSAAQAFIGDLERWVQPVFVGEPSSSSPNFVGESTGWIDLPYSGTRVTISERYHQHAALSDDARAWIAPQIPVELTSADYFSRRDPVLEATLRVIASRPHTY